MQLKMDKTYFMLVAIMISTCDGLPIETQWKQWKRQHAKTYLNGKDEFQRKLNWSKNAKFVEDFNQEDHRFSLAINHFSDLVSLISLIE